VSLVEALDDPARHDAVVDDCVRIIEEEVASKRGLRGAALKTGFKAFKAVRPGIVRSAVVRLLPHFAPAIDPHWSEARASPDPDAWFRAHAGEVADSLLGVTDGMAERASNRVLVRIYRSLRGSAREHVIAGVPRIPTLIAAHLDRDVAAGPR
jgi:hypothetical protein